MNLTGTVTVLVGDRLPSALRQVDDVVVVRGGIVCSATASRSAGTVGFAVGRTPDRAVAALSRKMRRAAASRVARLS